MINYAKLPIYFEITVINDKYGKISKALLMSLVSVCVCVCEDVRLFVLWVQLRGGCVGLCVTKENEQQKKSVCVCVCC